MNREKVRSRQSRTIGRTVTLLSLSISTGVLLSGCAFPWDAGQHEANRLTKVVDDLPGVEAAEATGTTNNITYPDSAMTDVTMSGDATPEQLEDVLVEWRAAADPGSKPSTMSKGITVTFRSEQCLAVASIEVPPEQIEDTATFLPALCAAVPDGTVSVADGEEMRHVTIGSPSGSPVEPGDVERLRILPGALTGHDYWEVDGVDYRWGADEFDFIR